MPLMLFRIDDRLIHGQVVVGWVNALKANSIIVINDAVAHNELQKCLLKMAVPPEIQVDIFAIDDFKLTMESKEITEKRVIILTSNPQDCLRIIENGFKIEEINLGGMRHSENKTQYTSCIFLNDEDISVFHKIEEKGVRISVKMLPVDKQNYLYDCLLKGGHKLEKN